jgi:hypothetical protein
MDRGCGNPSFHLSQVLIRHGCFGEYLHRIGHKATEACHEDQHTDQHTVQHTLEGCPAFEEERRVLVQRIGRDLPFPAVTEAMLSQEENWEAVATFCGSAMSRKEAAEKTREQRQDDGKGDYSLGGRRPPRPQQKRIRRSPSLLREMEENGEAPGGVTRTERVAIPSGASTRAASASKYSPSDTPSSE